MLSYFEALERVLGRVAALPARRATLAEAMGLAAAEDLLAREAVPPFANSAMDGFALRAADTLAATAAAPVRLPVQGLIQAGAGAVPALAPGSALRIMTGATLPEGADAIVPVEQVQSAEGWLELAGPVRQGAHIRLAGEDIPAGGRVVRAGATLRPAEIGVLAAIGCAEVPVHPRPRVAVLTTGNELVDAGAQPGPGQIRDANLHSLCAMVQAAGALPLPFARVPDTRGELRLALVQALAEADLVLSNGGVSVGDFDFLKVVLEDLGAEEVFWRVAQKPGAPLGLWSLGGKLVFGLPGNPVAAMLMFEEYVRPALRKLMGHRFLHRPWRTGVMSAAYGKGGDDRRTHFLRVVVTPDLRVALTGPQGSGLLASMMKANALAVVGPEQAGVALGGPVLLHCIDEPEDH